MDLQDIKNVVCYTINRLRTNDKMTLDERIEHLATTAEVDSIANDFVTLVGEFDSSMKDLARKRSKI